MQQRDRSHDGGDESPKPECECMRKARFGVLVLQLLAAGLNASTGLAGLIDVYHHLC